MSLMDVPTQAAVAGYGVYLRYAPAWLADASQRLLTLELACIAAFQDAAQDKWVAAVLLYLILMGIVFLSTYPLSFLRVMINFTPLAWPFRLRLQRFRPRNAAEGPSWLVITGPTGELGEEFATQFAQKGFSLFLIGRSKEKLAALEEKLGRAAPANQYRSHSIDLGSPTEDDWAALERALDGLPGKITILLNNAGVSHRRFVQFERCPVDDLVKITHVNILAVLRVTRMIVPKMVADRRGLIINVGSFSSHVPAPLLATYGGSKAFLYTWSQALGAQLEVKGVNVRVLNTYCAPNDWRFAGGG